MTDKDPLDPTGVIAESFRIDGIGEPECRSIFLDWALSLRPPQTPQAAIPPLLGRHSGEPMGHPMLKVLRQGLDAPNRTGRRGGAGARSRG